MAADASLAARLRDALARTRHVEERTLFGCVCFLLDGHLLVGVWKDSLIARLGPDQGKPRCGSRTSADSTSPAGR